VAGARFGQGRDRQPVDCQNRGVQGQAGGGSGAISGDGGNADVAAQPIDRAGKGRIVERARILSMMPTPGPARAQKRALARASLQPIDWTS
jgi:hypothetical protein